MTAFPIIDELHSQRQVLSPEMAVSTAPIASLPKTRDATRRRFDDTDWQASQLRRELRDRPSFTEAVTLEADHMLTVFVDHATKRETGRRVVMFAPAPAEQLAIAAEPPAFEIAPTLQAEAGAALAAMNQRRRRTDAPIARPRRFAIPSRWLAAGGLIAAIVLCVERSMG